MKVKELLARFAILSQQIVGQERSNLSIVVSGNVMSDLKWLITKNWVYFEIYKLKYWPIMWLQVDEKLKSEWRKVEQT